VTSFEVPRFSRRKPDDERSETSCGPHARRSSGRRSTGPGLSRRCSAENNARFCPLNVPPHVKSTRSRASLMVSLSSITTDPACSFV
jgi:hypothetical protein